MKVFGHPIHIMLIHFPSALFPLECLCYGFMYFEPVNCFPEICFFAMAAGVILGWLALIFGCLDLVKIPSDRTETIKQVLIHGSINGTVVIIYTVMAWMLYRKYPVLPMASGLIFLLKGALITFMIVGNFFGGNLVLKHKVGVE